MSKSEAMEFLKSDELLKEVEMGIRKAQLRGISGVSTASSLPSHRSLFSRVRDGQQTKLVTDILYRSFSRNRFLSPSSMTNWPSLVHRKKTLSWKYSGSWRRVNSKRELSTLGEKIIHCEYETLARIALFLRDGEMLSLLLAQSKDMIEAFRVQHRIQVWSKLSLHWGVSFLASKDTTLHSSSS